MLKKILSMNRCRSRSLQADHLSRQTQGPVKRRAMTYAAMSAVVAVARTFDMGFQIALTGEHIKETSRKFETLILTLFFIYQGLGTAPINDIDDEAAERNRRYEVILDFIETSMIHQSEEEDPEDIWLPCAPQSLIKGCKVEHWSRTRLYFQS
jgi:hypothetical protein